MSLSSHPGVVEFLLIQNLSIQVGDSLLNYVFFQSWLQVMRHRSGHSGQLSASGGDQGQKGPSCGRWVQSIGRQAGPWVPRVVRMSVSAKKSPARVAICCRKGDWPLPGPEAGLLSNTRKWIGRGDTCADKARDFIGKGHPGGEQ